MIVMLNGPFGVGKTSVANQLVQSIPNSMIFDPELVGTMLSAAVTVVKTPNEDTGDFQDLALWPKLVVEVARQLSECYRRTLLVPMTIDNIERLTFIKRGFEAFDDDVHHFCLTAPLETVEQRLRDRGCYNGEWEFRRARECVAAFVGPDFESYIDTRTADVSEAARCIVDSLAKHRVRSFMPV